MKVVEPGAAGSKGALEVSGEVIAGQGFSWAGVLYSPGATPMEPVNLSAKKNISFWAKGDGQTYTLAVMSEERSGQGMPPMTQFTAGPEWKQYTFPLAQFETDGSDLMGLGFVRAQQPGKFWFEIDQLEIK